LNTLGRAAEVKRGRQGVRGQVHHTAWGGRGAWPRPTGSTPTGGRRPDHGPVVARMGGTLCFKQERAAPGR
jgi:hypothetical protein